VIVRDLLERLAREIGLERYAVCCDTGPQIDRLLAINAGLVFRGKNGMCIHPQYGSWLVIGYLVCDLDLPHDRPLGEDCIGCGKCVAACPGGAITPNGVDANRCLSAITQKKGALTDGEIKMMLENGSIWGCDVCQNACPYTKKAEPTPIPYFKEGIITELTTDILDGMTDEELLSRPFSWRGREVVRRNTLYYGEGKRKAKDQD